MTGARGPWCSRWNSEQTLPVKVKKTDTSEGGIASLLVAVGVRFHIVIEILAFERVHWMPTLVCRPV